MRLGPSTTLNQLEAKFSSIFGSALADEDVLAAFYSAQQSEEETVTRYSCRIEDLLSKAVNSGKLQASEYSETLRTKLWGGLRQLLKDCTVHK
ncbi:hypothetical protein ACOMHN_016734 [Nucella lapillus]